jgi:hypothetical protein
VSICLSVFPSLQASRSHPHHLPRWGHSCGGRKPPSTGRAKFRLLPCPVCTLHLTVDFESDSQELDILRRISPPLSLPLSWIILVTLSHVRLLGGQWCCAVCLYVENPPSAAKCNVCDSPNYSKNKVTKPCSALPLPCIGCSRLSVAWYRVLLVLSYALLYLTLFVSRFHPLFAITPSSPNPGFSNKRAMQKLHFSQWAIFRGM